MKRDRSEIVPREALVAMSTAALLDLLDRELDVDSPADVNVALIKEITTILNARRGVSIDVDDVRKELESEHLGYEKLYSEYEHDSEEETFVKPFRRKKLGRLGLIAAVLVVLLVGITVTAQASGVNLWKAFSRWTEEVFEYNMAGDEPKVYINGQFSELNRVLADDGIENALVPRWLPEGYEFERLETSYGEYRADFKKNEKSLKIQIHQTQTGNATRIEKNDGEPEVYVVNGIDHHIVSNLERVSATWMNEGYECTIYGIPSIEDAHKIIESIYWED